MSTNSGENPTEGCSSKNVPVTYSIASLILLLSTFLVTSRLKSFNE